MDKILVTGGAGYIGSHVVERLVYLKKKVFIIDNLSTGHKKLVHKKATFFKIDILDTLKVKKIILQNNIDSIIHLAASLIISEGEKYPKKYYRNNVIGTSSLIEACRYTSVKNLIFSSTAAVYKDGLSKVKENSELKPKSVYGKTKLKSEKIIQKNCQKLKINYGILRYFNIAGSSPSGKIGLINKSDHLFKNFSIEVSKKKPLLKIYGTNYNTKDGSCIRDFIHVTDIADIHLKVLEKISKLKKSQILNCGYSKGTSVLEVAKEFQRQVKKNVNIVSLPRRSGDLVKVIAVNNKLKNFIKWKPRFNELKFIVKSCLKWEKNQ